jgi:hypothetical protein
MAVERKSGEATGQERGPSSAEEARELLAQRLIWKMETFDPGLEERSWFDLCDAEHALYRHSITAIFQERELARIALGEFRRAGHDVVNRHAVLLGLTVAEQANSHDMNLSWPARENNSEKWTACRTFQVNFGGGTPNGAPTKYEMAEHFPRTMLGSANARKPSRPYLITIWQ